MASSVLGEWNVVFHWPDWPGPPPTGSFIFKKDGSFTCGGEDRCGWWVEKHGMLFLVWPDSYPPGLVYTANVTHNALAGIMGYACDKSGPERVPPTGTWSATRVTLAEAKAAPGKQDFDPLTDMPKKPKK